MHEVCWEVETEPQELGEFWLGWGKRWVLPLKNGQVAPAGDIFVGLQEAQYNARVEKGTNAFVFAAFWLVDRKRVL